MCFDEFGNLRTTNFGAGTMTLFDDSANILTHPWAGPFSAFPESCVVDAAGDVYTGEVDGANLIRKWSPDGLTEIATFSPLTGPRGVDWIDLAEDQCTMRYTSEGGIIHQYDVCLDQQLPDFATGLPAPCGAHRILPDGGSLVACQSAAIRLGTAGQVVNTYLASGFNPPANFLFTLNLDPDGTSFWTANTFPGNIYRIDIATGNQIGGFNVPIVGSTLAGLAVIGELTPPITVCEIQGGAYDHWDKIIFSSPSAIKKPDGTILPRDVPYDIKVLDDPTDVAFLQKKVSDFLNANGFTRPNGAPFGSHLIVIIDVEYTAVCVPPFGPL